MCTRFTFLLLGFLGFCSLSGQVMIHTAQGGYLNTALNHEHHSEVAQERLNTRISEIMKEITDVEAAEKNVPVFGTPLKKSSKSFVNNPEYFYSISAYYDHNDVQNAYHDMNCEALSYDRHEGTDFFAFPFYWYQYENELLDVVAAEEGEIILKVDAAENCANNDGDFGVHIAVRHGNYVSIYAHLKEGTLTSKSAREGSNPGDRVQKGEVLGKVGFSGNSPSGPHLHFQVNRDQFQNETIDPYETTCGNARSQDLMERKQEREYKYTELLSLTTHTADPVWASSCNDSYLENPFFGDKFHAGEDITIIAAIRDFTNQQELSVTLRDGSGIIRQQWRLDMEDIAGSSPAPRHLTAVYAKLQYKVKDTDPTGDWKIGAVVRENNRSVGRALEKECNISPTTSTEENIAHSMWQIYPNPCSSMLTLKHQNATLVNRLEVLDLTGRIFPVIVRSAGENKMNLDLRDLNSGVYILRLTDQSGNQSIRRFLKQ